MPEMVKQGVRVDVIYKQDDDSWELCYQEAGQAVPVVLKITRGYESFLATALAAMREHTCDYQPFKLTIVNEYEVFP